MDYYSKVRLVADRQQALMRAADRHRLVASCGAERPVWRLSGPATRAWSALRRAWLRRGQTAVAGPSVAAGS